MGDQDIIVAPIDRHELGRGRLMLVSNLELSCDGGWATDRQEAVEVAARRAPIAEAHAQFLRPGLVLVLVEPELGVVGPPLGRRIVLRAAAETLGILVTQDAV